MIGLVRIYAELRADIPEPHRPPNPTEYTKVLDVDPHQVRAICRDLRRQGYTTICIPL